MPKYIVKETSILYKEVEADSPDEAEQWVQENEMWLGRDQENEYEFYLESEEEEEDWV